MTEQTQLPEAIQKRIEGTAKSIEWNTGSIYDAAYKGAESEALRAHKLVEALEFVFKDFKIGIMEAYIKCGYSPQIAKDMMEDRHKVKEIQKIIEEYNSLP